MTLRAGSRIGSYEIVAPIGAGGMGEVYRARDTRLGRDVAIKVLPEELAQVQERLDRFEREAKLLAALNHANVATLYGLEHEGGSDGEQQFLVMELVEGETLAERIARGPLPFDEARELFVQIAEGLEAAHDKGIVHRDLKPANIKITPEGKIKILDFGLAKAFAPEADGPAEASQSPTLTKGTALGAILGTAAYMSPEQARGKLVDRRTDVWAFGCCLYEALTGRRAFEGETLPDTLSAVLTREPDWTRLPAGSPHVLLERTLRKDATRRLQHVGDARLELLEPNTVASVPIGTPSASLFWIAGASLVAAVLGFLLRGAFEPSADIGSAPPAVRTRIVLPDGLELVVARGIDQRVGRYPPIAISEDGRHLAIVARDGGGVSRIYVRALDELELRPLAGSENAELPFFSPEGTSVGFLVGSRVFTAPVAGGIATLIGNAPLGTARGAAWVNDETIVLGGVNAGLSRMNVTTGDVAPLTNLDDSTDGQHSWPRSLGDGEHVLFNAWSNGQSRGAVVSLSTPNWRFVEQTDNASLSSYLDSGHLVFFRGGGLFAARFDRDDMAIEGPIVNVPLGDFVTGRASGVDLGYFAVARNGTLVLVPGTVDLGAFELVRVNRSGEGEPISEPRSYLYVPAVSPDGTRVAVVESPLASVYVHDLRRGTRSKLSGPGINPVWSADGRRLYFDWFPGGGDGELFAVAADGSGEPETLLTRPYDQYSVDASDDGRFLVFEEIHPDTGWDLHLLPLDGGEPYPFLVTASNERDGAFSPDGRYLAYASDETGRAEIYVRALSGEGGAAPISADGGIWPRWSPRGDELYYRQGTTMMAVPVELEPAFQPGIPFPLFDGNYAEKFDVFPNGDFALITLAEGEFREIELVVNWSTELAGLVPVENDP